MYLPLAVLEDVYGSQEASSSSQSYHVFPAPSSDVCCCKSLKLSLVIVSEGLRVDCSSTSDLAPSLFILTPAQHVMHITFFISNHGKQRHVARRRKLVTSSRFYHGSPVQKLSHGQRLLLEDAIADLLAMSIVNKGRRSLSKL